MEENNNNKFKIELTEQEIDAEIAKIRNFFEQISDDLKFKAAICCMHEIAIGTSENFYEAIGIFEEAKLSFRRTYLKALKEIENEDEDEDDHKLKE